VKECVTQIRKHATGTARSTKKTQTR